METKTFRSRAATKIVWPVLALVLLILVNVLLDARSFNSFTDAFREGAFLHISFKNGYPSGALIDILNHGSKVMILALGMSLVIATGGVDLSVGAVMAISGAAAAVLTVRGLPPTIVIPIALLISMVCGLWNGILVGMLKIQPIVATLILMVAGRGVAQMITGAQIITFHSPVMEFIGNGRLAWLPLPFPFILVLIMLFITWVCTRKTAIGLLVESVGSNPTASRFAGVRATSVIMMAYIFSGFCAGIAGLIAASNIKAADPTHAGLLLEMDAIFAVVVGGTALTGGRFFLGGAIIGGILIQTLTTTMYAQDVSADVAPLPKAIVVLIVCLIQSETFRNKLSKTWRRKQS
ncbi:MAG: ABC transporter permease [Verrucomicrobiota bacterium]|jgi:ribose/xylose/arabinose/galactoside ABC-type transport system permease subunit|nr:ABC transporter permease [Verrucomicrobiota bacterium]MDI9385666.1 ABC transporter permease [Verrucomicrobiota bacterium]